MRVLNEDTRPSWHISHPRRADVFYSCFQSLKKIIKRHYNVPGVFAIIVYRHLSHVPC